MARESIADFLFELGFDGKKVEKGLEQSKRMVQDYARDVKKILADAVAPMTKPMPAPALPPKTKPDKGFTEGQVINKQGDVSRLLGDLKRLEDSGKITQEGQIKQLDALRARLRGISQDFAKVKNAKEKAQLGNSFKEARGQVQRFSKEVNQAAREMTNLEKVAARAKASVLNMATGFASAFAAVEAFRQAVQQTIAFESIERGLTDVMGSAEKAAIEIEFLKEQSKELGLFFPEAAKDYMKLAAALKDTQPEITRDLFVELTKRMKVFGATSAQVQLGMKAIQQTASKGRVSMEELKNQLGDQLPAAFAIAANAMNMTQAELIKLIESGKLTSEEFLPKFVKELKAMNKNLGPDAFKTLERAVTNFASSLAEAAAVFGERGFGRGLTFFLNRLVEILDNLDPVLALLGGVAQGLFFFGGALLFAIELLTKFINMIAGGDSALTAMEGLGTIIGVLIGGAVLGRFLKMFGWVVGLFGKTEKGANKVASSLGGIKSVVTGGKGIFGGLLKSLPKLLFRLIPVVGWIGLLYEAFKLLFGLFDDEEKKASRTIIGGSQTLTSDEAFSRFRAISDENTMALPAGMSVSSNRGSTVVTNDNRIIMSVEGGLTQDLLDEAISRQAEIIGDDA